MPLGTEGDRMSIVTNLRGRLRNTSLPVSSGMLPLYEAVSNSIHAIEDSKIEADQGMITIHIIRDRQTAIDFEGNSRRPGPEAKGDITGFKITDNGIGFNDANMDSFLTLDSDYKVSRGGRGVGRLLWLKAFECVTVESIYETKKGVLKKRSFRFDAHQGVSELPTSNVNAPSSQTVIHLSGFSKRYREASRKTTKVIAKNLFEHCLWYFVRPGGAPTIKIIDNDETILLDNIYEEYMVAGASQESIELKGTRFDLIHVKLSASSARGHSIAFCAANRLVTQENI